MNYKLLFLIIATSGATQAFFNRPPKKPESSYTDKALQGAKYAATAYGLLFGGTVAHELGHAFTGVAMGVSPKIIIVGKSAAKIINAGGKAPSLHIGRFHVAGLNPREGFCWFSEKLKTSYLARPLISVAGPLAGAAFTVAAASAASQHYSDDPIGKKIAGAALSLFALENSTNLLPLRGSDGGHAFEVLTKNTQSLKFKATTAIGIASASLGMFYTCMHHVFKKLLKHEPPKKKGWFDWFK